MPQLKCINFFHNVKIFAFDNDLNFINKAKEKNKMLIITLQM